MLQPGEILIVLLLALVLLGAEALARDRAQAWSMDR